MLGAVQAMALASPATAADGPACHPFPGFTSSDVLMRAGETRHFGIVCERAVSARVGTPPVAGAITSFVPSTTFATGMLTIDATYVPEGSSADPFTVIARDAAGLEAASQLRFLPDPSNGGRACSYSSATTRPSTPVTLGLTCMDAHGDPQSAAIHRAPEHGAASPPELGPAPYGGQHMSFEYRPDAGFEGNDTLEVAIADDHGGPATVIPLEVAVFTPPAPDPPAPFQPWIVDDFPPRHSEPRFGPPPTQVEQARKALKTPSVKLLARADVARVWGVRAKRHRTLAFTCEHACYVHARFHQKGRRHKPWVRLVRVGSAKRLQVPKTRARLTLRLQIKSQGRSKRTTLRFPARR